ncbi:sporulation protein [Neobacillus sp. 179-J 1A1 HS]|jgi:sporulation-control protein spo0M|uniref:sporulation protein n=1 Tax=Neobacillus driksii TaxID=3035913 RepID=UPI002780EA55|nr:sporulation protein [Neobacillus niacini]MDQ0976443.1 sporulation-control protein spo0M [Neobacillus niacini]
MPIFREQVKMKMTLKDYLTKLKIGLPKTMVHLDKQVYEAGSIINGTIEITGGLLKNKIKRYDIDLVGVDSNSFVEETLNSHSVFCSLECSPNQTGKITFFIDVPEEIKKNHHTFQYSLMINIDLGNANNITQNVPVMIGAVS